MPKLFPDRVDPWRLADREQVIQGELALASMPRLSPQLNAAGGSTLAAFSLSFYRGQGKQAVIRCQVDVTLELICQRCLEAMDLVVESDSLLALVEGLDEAEALPDDLEPLLVPETGMLSVSELVEDELLLTVPDVPRHADQDCALNMDDYADHRELEEAQVEANPFDVLAVLKDGK